VTVRAKVVVREASARTPPAPVEDSQSTDHWIVTLAWYWPSGSSTDVCWYTCEQSVLWASSSTAGS
jgi:hypothetical protein